MYRKLVEQKRTIRFLLGLNKDLDEVRGRIMGIKPLPTIREAFAKVRREESRKKLMITDNHTHLLLRGRLCTLTIPLRIISPGKDDHGATIVRNLVI